MKKLTLKDATKEELIQYFFSPECVGGGYRIQADKERFLIWLEQKRAGELMDAQEANYDASQKALKLMRLISVMRLLINGLKA